MTIFDKVRQFIDEIESTPVIKGGYRAAPSAPLEQTKKSGVWGTATLMMRKLKRKEVKDMNIQEVLTALEEIETDLRSFSLVTPVLNLIDKVEALKGKLKPVIENAEAATEQIAKDVEVAVEDVRNAGDTVAPVGSEGLVNPEIPPVEPVQPGTPVEPVVPSESESTAN